VSSYWYRRGRIAIKRNHHKDFSQLYDFNIEEQTCLNEIMESSFSSKSLNSFKTSTPNKLLVLEAARKSGIKIPQYFIIDNKQDLISLLENFELITKCITGGAVIMDPDSNELFLSYTTEINQDKIRAFLDNFFPSFFQRKIKKRYEVSMSYFKLHTNFLLVKSTNRSLLIDLQREQIELFPNDLTSIIEELNHRKTVEELIAEYGEENKEVIIDYLSHLERKEFGFFLDEHELDYFPEISHKFSTPRLIYNAILELGDWEDEYFSNVIDQLELLGCNKVSIVSFHTINKDKLDVLLSYFRNTRVDSIVLTLKFNHELGDKKYIHYLTNKFHRITNILLVAVPKDQYLKATTKSPCNVHYTSKSVDSFKYCGAVNQEYFFPNSDKVFESMDHNSCLYKKISIDQIGDIKNCPSMNESFGDVAKTSLAVALKLDGFKKYWNLSKDKVDVCKDCEFRHVCTDCRAYLDNPSDKYSKPLKCGYDPYTNIWQEWSTDKLKKEAIQYYGL